jgi:hypothetical protein
MLFRNIADVNNRDAYINKLRRSRFALFQSLLAGVPRPLSILDVGGEPGFWRMMGFASFDDVAITLINVHQWENVHPPFHNVWGDARDMRQFRDGQFDVVFSNSVIEHVGNFDDQQRMANEVQRVGRRYFVQTPNRNFPVEPHFFFPGFQFLPINVRVWLVQHFALGWFPRMPDAGKARQEVEQIQLLTGQQVRRLFPSATLAKEKFLGLTVGFLAYGGW